MRAVVTGHRPNKLGGYDRNNPTRAAIRAAFEHRLRVLAPERAYSGMALGVDQDFVDVCIELEIPFVAVVPFEGQESQWPWESREYYHAQLKKASEVVYVSPPGYASWKMHRRNEWQVDEIGPDGIVLAVWDGSSGGTANCVAYARSRNRKIEIIDPDSLDLDHVVL